ncbi:hypothetical protein HYFRA_00008539 [Hymenoscyphus fraxineus]|uniref:Uncharacterized protein n=1 Tax=Hymenoscyphus fraxineus TaxID=746836 RepID=A0A9N9KYE1_9HELO|nr:hypothetical protein HYFRA_00008539 [Hymenoscyphus fraxineus]
MVCRIGLTGSPYLLPLVAMLRKQKASYLQRHSEKNIVVYICNMETTTMIATGPEVLLEGPVKPTQLTTWHPCLELSDDENGKTRWRIVMRTEDEKCGTFLVLRELSNESTRTLYVIPPPVPQQPRNRREQKQANHVAHWKSRQIIITIRLEGHRCCFPSVFTHKPIDFAEMARKSLQQPFSPAFTLFLEDDQPETLTVAVALHKAFLKFVAKKLLNGPKANLRSRSTHVTKGLDRGSSNDDQAIVETSDWEWGRVVDTSMNGIKTYHVPRNWTEEMFDRDSSYRRYRVFRMSNLRHSWSYEDEGEQEADEDLAGVEEMTDQMEELMDDGEAITHWDIEEPWWLEEVTEDTTE